MAQALPDIVTLLSAYASGYFPMPDPETGEILWYRPDPRAILPLDAFHVSRSLKKTLHSGLFRVTHDTAFEQVMQGCADRPDTWITQAFFERYTELFKARHAHSVEVWQGDQLVGGIYGVSFQGAFFAESKFHRATDASKVALFHLVERLRESGYVLLEVQFLTPHLERLGVREISDTQYQRRLKAALKLPAHF